MYVFVFATKEIKSSVFLTSLDHGQWKFFCDKLKK